MEKSSAGRGVVVLAISSIILKILSALYIPVLNKIIGEDGFSIYIVGYKIFIFLLIITSFGVQPAITKVVAELRARGKDNEALKVMKTARKYMFIYGLIVSLIFIIVSVPISKILNSEQSFLSFIFLAPAIILAAVLSAYRGYLQGYNDMVSLSISNIIEQVFNVLFSLFFAFQFMKISIGFGSAGGTIGTSIGAIGAIIYIIYVFNKKYKFNHSSNVVVINGKTLKEKSILKKLLRYAIPITLVAAIQNLLGLIDLPTVRLLITGNADQGTATLEYFNTIINVPISIITALGIAVFPKIIKGFIEKDKDELKIQTSYCYKLIYIITIPSVFGLTILSKDIFRFVFDTNFGYELLLYGSITLIFISISSIQNIILQGMNKFKFIVVVGLFAMIVKLFCNIILIRIDRINIMGAVIGSAMAFIIITIINHIKLQEYFDVKISILKQAKAPIIASIIMSISLLLVKYILINPIVLFSDKRIDFGIGIVILISIGAIIYSISMLLLGGITKYELDTISPKIYKLLPNKLKKNILYF